MKRLLLPAALFAVAFGPARYLVAHCEVPCGIYADQRRFEQMLEDQKTIAKAVGQFNDLADNPDRLSINQMIRWVNTKESHATNTQHIIAQYFLTQRIKADQANYVERLKTAHAVMVAAMKCKQTTDAGAADALRTAILNFYRAYEGKEPQFEE